MNESTCIETQDLIEKRSAGALGRADQARLDAHIAECAECAADLDLVDRLAEEEVIPEPAELDLARMRNSVMREIRAPRHGEMFRWAAAAAIAVAVFGGGVFIGRQRVAPASTMGGDIKVKTAKQFVKAKTMGGEIQIDEVDGSVDATTMGGEIKANVVGTGAGHDVALRSMGGDITLTLPASFSGSFDVELTYTKNSSRNYTIKSDFPLSVKESPDWDYDKGSPRKVITGTGGSGANKVRISTINGNVVIRKK